MERSQYFPKPWKVIICRTNSNNTSPGLRHISLVACFRWRLCYIFKLGVICEKGTSCFPVSNSDNLCKKTMCSWLSRKSLILLHFSYVNLIEQTSQAFEIVPLVFLIANELFISHRGRVSRPPTKSTLMSWKSVETCPGWQFCPGSESLQTSPWLKDGFCIADTIN